MNAPSDDAPFTPKPCSAADVEKLIDVLERLIARETAYAEDPARESRIAKLCRSGVRAVSNSLRLARADLADGKIAEANFAFRLGCLLSWEIDEYDRYSNDEDNFGRSTISNALGEVWEFLA